MSPERPLESSLYLFQEDVVEDDHPLEEVHDPDQSHDEVDRHVVEVVSKIDQDVVLPGFLSSYPPVRGLRRGMVWSLVSMTWIGSGFPSRDSTPGCQPRDYGRD